MKTVIESLLEAGEACVPDDALARQAGLAPAGIDREIAGLRQRGYAIESVPGRGHRLASMPDRLYPERIMHRLGTAKVARSIVYFPEVDSTNRAARELALKGAEEGTLVVAEHQTRGRGRLDRTWEAEPHSAILCSLVLHPDLPAASAFRLTMLASVAVVRAIADVCGLKAGIKWPNDVYLNGRKVCGVLTECLAEHEHMRYCVIGIGVNVHGGFEGDPRLAGMATSLSAEAGVAVSRAGFLQAMLRDIDAEYARFGRTGGRHLLEPWERFSLVTGKAVTITSPGEPPLSGIARGITDNGHLLLRDGQGAEHTILCGDVSLRI